MVDVLNKVIGIIIAFVMLIVAPTIMMRVTDDSAMKRQVLNEVESFIDKVTDASALDAQSVNLFNSTINAHGVPFSIKLVRFEKVAIPTEVGDYTVVPIAKQGELKLDASMPRVRLEVGDIIQVTVSAMTPTQGQLLAARWLKQAGEPITFTLAGTVR